MPVEANSSQDTGMAEQVSVCLLHCHKLFSFTKHRSFSYDMRMQDTGDKEDSEDGHTAVLSTIVPNPTSLRSLATVEEGHPSPVCRSKRPLFLSGTG